MHHQSTSHTSKQRNKIVLWVHVFQLIASIHYFYIPTNVWTLCVACFWCCKPLKMPLPNSRFQLECNAFALLPLSHAIHTQTHMAETKWIAMQHRGGRVVPIIARMIYGHTQWPWPETWERSIGWSGQNVCKCDDEFGRNILLFNVKPVNFLSCLKMLV